MKIDINLKSKSENKLPHYVLEIWFEEGQSETFHFYENEIEELKSLIMAFECCKVARPNNRSTDSDNYHGLLEYDTFFNEFPEDASKYYFYSKEEVLKKINEINPNEIYIRHPHDAYDRLIPFHVYTLCYIDSEGSQYSVNVTLEDDDLARIEVCRNYFN